MKDFTRIIPDSGTIKDLKNLVAKIHSMGVFIIIEWVGNHSALENFLAKDENFSLRHGMIGMIF